MHTKFSLATGQVKSGDQRSFSPRSCVSAAVILKCCLLANTCKDTMDQCLQAGTIVYVANPQCINTVHLSKVAQSRNAGESCQSEPSWSRSNGDAPVFEQSVAHSLSPCCGFLHNDNCRSLNAEMSLRDDQEGITKRNVGKCCCPKQSGKTPL